MGNDKTNIFLVAIVGIVAVAGLVFLFSGKNNVVMVSAEDSLSGAAVFSPSKTIQKNDLFILPVGAFAPTTTSTAGEILQYKGADKPNVKEPKIKFKQWSTGESLEYAVENGRAEIKMGGKQFKVKLIKSTKMDSPLQIDLDGDGGIDTVLPAKLFSIGPQGLKGLGYTCDQVLTLQVGEGKTVGSSDNKLLKLVSLDGQEAIVQVKTITASSFTVEKSAPFFNGETIDVGLYSVHLLNLDNPAGIPQATFCVNF